MPARLQASGCTVRDVAIAQPKLGPIYRVRLADGSLSVWRGRLTRVYMFGGRRRCELSGGQRRVTVDERDMVLTDEQELPEVQV